MQAAVFSGLIHSVSQWFKNQRQHLPSDTRNASTRTPPNTKPPAVSLGASCLSSLQYLLLRQQLDVRHLGVETVPRRVDPDALDRGWRRLRQLLH